MMHFLFWFSLAMILYVYVGYPCLVFMLGMIKGRDPAKSEGEEPTISILIAAYNEEECIKQTIDNKLALIYPEEKMEIIVVSDGSTDRTDAIVKGYRNKNVTLIRQYPRAGKTSALNLAIKKTRGDVVVFSDANSLYDPNALRKLAANFADKNVGYVTGKMVYTSINGFVIGDGCSMYMRYENFIRRHETKIGSVVGVDGGIDAVRKELYTPMKDDQLPDFVLPLSVVEKKYRVVYEPEAILKEASLKESRDEYRMRVRVSLRALWALRDMKQLFSFRDLPLFAWQLWSHKLLRYLCFLFLGTAYLSNLVLAADGYLFGLLFILQTAAYAGAAGGSVFQKQRKQNRLLYLLHYFVLLNLASAHACVKFITGEKMITWTPRKG